MKPYMIKGKNESSFVEMAPGIRNRTMSNGNNTVICEFRFEKGAVVPSHSHIFEQTEFLISGKLIFKIDGNEH